jgi:hypothetical protein
MIMGEIGLGILVLNSIQQSKTLHNDFSQDNIV